MFDTRWKMAHTIALCVSGIINKAAAGRTTNQTTAPVWRSGDCAGNNLGATPLSELYGVYNRLTNVASKRD